MARPAQITGGSLVSENSPFLYSSKIRHFPRRIFRCYKIRGFVQCSRVSYSATRRPLFPSSLPLSVPFFRPSFGAAKGSLRSRFSSLGKLFFCLLTYSVLCAIMYSATNWRGLKFSLSIMHTRKPKSLYVHYNPLFDFCQGGVLSRLHPPSNGPPQKRLIRGPSVRVLAVTSRTAPPLIHFNFSKEFNLQKYTSKEIKCPFYLFEQNHMIFCEGITTETQSTAIIFKNNKSLSNYKKTLCNCLPGYESCPLAKLLLERYAENLINFG